MPYSDPDNKALVSEWLQELRPKTILDIGPGAGVYGTLSRHIDSVERVDCVEVWEPYVSEFGLSGIYDQVWIRDARNHELFDYDVVIFGDVLEHMSREDAVELYERALKSAKAVIFSIPIIHLPQGAYAGNPYETHVEDDWKHEEILEAFASIKKFQTFRVTGVYLACDS